MGRRFWLKLLTMTLLLPAAAFAEQSRTFGDYTIHYSAFTTDTLSPEVAKQYQIPRSKNRAMVNISVLKKENSNKLIGKPVRARIEGAARNLSEQLRTLQIREVISDDAVYYIAETPIANQETLKYNFQITPEGEQTAYQITFEEQFYTN